MGSALGAHHLNRRPGLRHLPPQPPPSRTCDRAGRQGQERWSLSPEDPDPPRDRRNR